MTDKILGKIVGTGFYAPEKIVTNDFFDTLYNRDVGTFLRTKRNIYERRFMDEMQATSDLIVPAAKTAMEQAGIKAEEVDLILVATDTPDYISPATAAVVQYKLKAKNAAGYDINSACAGFVTALDMACKYIACDTHYKNILVVGAYGMSKYLNYEDYKIASLFADGAGAVVVQPSSDGTGVLASCLDLDGQYHDYMGIYAGGTRAPLCQAVLDRKDHLLNFVKKIPTETNGTRWPQLTNYLLDQTHRQKTDINHFFLTQINIQSINETLDSLALSRELSHNIMNRFGYTGSASIPMALADAVTAGKLRHNDLIIMIGSGGGMSMAALALTWGIDK
jgi:3-oxoacyl-[acyl-carrier-protein] synthase-3